VLKIEVGVGVGAGVGVGTGVGVGAGVGPPGDTDTVGVAGGRAGAVGQWASAGLNAVGLAEGVTTADDALALALAPAVGLELALAPAGGVDVGDGVGVTTYGVYDGHGASGGTGGWCDPVTTSEMATAMAPTRTVATKVIAPHSRRKTSFMR
jgi:hypothetical protein